MFGFFLAHHIEATFSLGMFADSNLCSALYNCLRLQHSGAAGLIGSVVFWVVPPGVTSSVLLNHIMVLGSGCRGNSCLSSFSSGHTSANICITHTHPGRSAAKQAAGIRWMYRWVTAACLQASLAQYESRWNIVLCVSKTIVKSIHKSKTLCFEPLMCTYATSVLPVSQKVIISVSTPISEEHKGSKVNNEQFTDAKLAAQAVGEEF